MPFYYNAEFTMAFNIFANTLVLLGAFAVLALLITLVDFVARPKVRAGVYMYCAPWLNAQNMYHPTRRDRKNLLTSKNFWTVSAARHWAEQTHRKYCKGESSPTVTTVAFVAYGDWEDLMPATPYYAFPEDYGTNNSVWTR